MNIGINLNVKAFSSGTFLMSVLQDHNLFKATKTTDQTKSATHQCSTKRSLINLKEHHQCTNPYRIKIHTSSQHWNMKHLHGWCLRSKAANHALRCGWELWWPSTTSPQRASLSTLPIVFPPFFPWAIVKLSHVNVDLFHLHYQRHQEWGYVVVTLLCHISFPRMTSNLFNFILGF